MSEPLLKVVQLRKSFGGVVATDSLDFDVMPGEIHAVIGPNGAGKTTFVAQIAGMLKSDSGTITFDGRDMAGKTAPERSHMGLARSFQITSVFRDFTAHWKTSRCRSRPMPVTVSGSGSGRRPTGT